MQKNKFTFYTACRFISSTFFFILLNACANGSAYLSLSLFNAFLFLGCNAVVAALAFIASTFINFNLTKVFCGVIAVAIVTPFYLFFRKKKIKITLDKYHLVSKFS